MGGAPGICLRSGGQSTGVSSCLLGGRPLPKLGDCSRCARPAGTLAAEKYVLAGGAGQNMIASFSAGCGRRNSARRALPGESVGRRGGLGPWGLFAGCRPDLLGVPYRARGVGRKGRLGPWGLFAGCRPDLLGVPCRASRWGGKVGWALRVFAGCRLDLLGLPCRASRWGGKVSWALWVFLRAAARTCWVCPAGRVGGTERFVGPFGGLRIGASIRLCT